MSFSQENPELSVHEFTEFTELINQLNEQIAIHEGFNSLSELIDYLNGFSANPKPYASSLSNDGEFKASQGNTSTGSRLLPHDTTTTTKEDVYLF